MFAAVYRFAAQVADLFALDLLSKVNLLLAAPKVTQAVFAALLDCYTWKLAELVYGRGSRTALTTVRRHAAILLCQRQIVDSALFSACIGSLQPVAMVLLHSDIVKLPRNYYHDNCHLLLALALA